MAQAQEGLQNGPRAARNTLHPDRTSGAGLAASVSKMLRVRCSSACFFRRAASLARCAFSYRRSSACSSRNAATASGTAFLPSLGAGAGCRRQIRGQGRVLGAGDRRLPTHVLAGCG